MEKKTALLIEGIIAREGGYVNHPHDRGGPTKYGITIKTLATYRGRPASVEEIMALLPDEAARIYEHLYFIAPNFAKLPEPIWEVMLDGAVHSGPAKAAGWLQQVINDADFGPVEVDGHCGPVTIAAATRAYAAMDYYLPLALLSERRQFLLGLIARDPTQKDFRRGWMNRLRQLALDIAPNDQKNFVTKEFA